MTQKIRYFEDSLFLYRIVSTLKAGLKEVDELPVKNKSGIFQFHSYFDSFSMKEISSRDLKLGSSGIFGKLGCFGRQGTITNVIRAEIITIDAF